MLEVVNQDEEVAGITVLVLKVVILTVDAKEVEVVVDREDLEDFDDVEVCRVLLVLDVNRGEEVGGINVLVVKVVILPVGAEVVVMVVGREEDVEVFDDVEVCRVLLVLDVNPGEEVAGIAVLVVKVVILPVGDASEEVVMIDGEELGDIDDAEVCGAPVLAIDAAISEKK